MEQTLFNDKCGDIDPFEVFATWMQKAMSEDPKTGNAASVATADKNGIPSVRVLLLKFFDENGFVFFSNLHFLLIDVKFYSMISLIVKV